MALREARRTRRLYRRCRVTPGADELCRTRRGNGAPGLLVRLLGVGAQLEHVAKNDDAAPAPGAGLEGFERGAQRRGVRVVRVVEDGERPDRPPHASALG